MKQKLYSIFIYLFHIFVGYYTFEIEIDKFHIIALGFCIIIYFVWLNFSYLVLLKILIMSNLLSLLVEFFILIFNSFYLGSTVSAISFFNLISIPLVFALFVSSKWKILNLLPLIHLSLIWLSLHIIDSLGIAFLFSYAISIIFFIYYLKVALPFMRKKKEIE